MKNLFTQKLKASARCLRGARSGFTLIELLVAMVVSAILMGAVTVLIVSAYQSFSAVTRQSEAHNIAVLVLQKIQSKVRYANGVTIYADNYTPGNDSDPNPLIFFSQNTSNSALSSLDVEESGKCGIYFQGLFKSYNCTLAFSKGASNLLNVTITITNSHNGKTVFSTNSGIYLINSDSPSFTGVSDNPVGNGNNGPVLSYLTS